MEIFQKDSRSAANIKRPGTDETPQEKKGTICALLASGKRSRLRSWASKYYSVSGQLKTMLDRANPLYGTDYAFTKVYLLAAAAENELETVEGAKKAVQGWVDCFDRAEFADTVFAGGVNDVGDIAGHLALETAHKMGADIQ